MDFSLSLKNCSDKVGNLHFRDSICLINSKLEFLSRDLLGQDNSKEKTPTDWESLTELTIKEKILDNKEKKETLIFYLKKDCTCILDSLHEFDRILDEIFKKTKLFSVLDKMTLSSISKALFLRDIYDFMYADILHLNLIEDRLFRKFYFGGRTQPFYIGVFKGKMFYYDFN
jgi:hypothetical protein